jgi:multidrug efflux system outer membrane protein
MREGKILLGALAVTALGAALGGCTVGPKYKRPAYSTPAAYRGPDENAVTTDAKDSLGDQEWSKVFR